MARGNGRQTTRGGQTSAHRRRSTRKNQEEEQNVNYNPTNTSTKKVTVEEEQVEDPQASQRATKKTKAYDDTEYTAAANNPLGEKTKNVQNASQQLQSADNTNRNKEPELPDMNVDRTLTPGNGTNENGDQQSSDQEEEDIDDITPNDRLYVTVNSEDLRGNLKNKIKTVENFLKEKTYNEIKVVNMPKQRKFKIHVYNKEDYDNFIKLEINDTITVQDGETNEPTIQGKIVKFQPMGQTAAEKRKENELCKERTIQVINIPLEIEYNTIKRHFTQFGSITEGKCKVFMNQTRLYQTAYITYDDKDSIQQFYERNWSTDIGKDSVGVIPLCLSDEYRKKRKDLMFKLSGLPFGTTSFDLKKMTEDHNIKYCFIPRNGKTNHPMRYALMYFGNEESFDLATNKIFYFKNMELFWTEPNRKTCLICGNPGHVKKDCDKKQNKRPFKNRNQRLKDFQNNRSRNYNKPKSYADATKRGTNNRFRNKDNKPYNNNFGNKDNKSHDNKNFRPWNDVTLRRREIEKNMNDWDECGVIPPYRQNKNNNTSMHDTNIQGTVHKLVDSIKNMTSQLNIVRNETMAVMDEIKSMKKKKDDKPVGNSVNRQRSTKSIINDNNKRTKVDNEVPTDHDMSDLENRVNQANGKLDTLSNGIANINNTLLQLQQQLQKQVDVEEDEEFNDAFEVDGDNFEAEYYDADL